LINLDPSTQGRKVLDTEFESYLSSIAEGWDRWEKERRLGRRGRADLGALQDERRESLFHYERSRSNDQKRDQKEKTEHEEREEEVLPALEDVPAIFFEEGFNLSNPRTFDLVTEKILETPRGSPIVARKRLDFGHISNSVSSTDDAISTSTPASPSSRPGLGPLTLADLATDSLLQEKLSHYTAIVESHLVKEIGLRSSSFFSALENLQGLQDKGEECLAKIEGLSHLLDGSNSSHSDVTAAASMSRGGIGQGAMRGLKILRFQARRRGLDQIDRSVVEVEEIWRGIEAVQQLIEASEWIAALEVGEAVEQRYLGQHGSASRGINYKVEELDRSREGSIDLMRIKALNHIPSKINSLRHQISQALQSELMGILGREMDASVDQYVKLSSRSQSSEKRQHGTTRSHPTTIISTENQVGSAELNEGKIVARERVIESIDLVIKGLVRADGIDAAVLAWKEVILRDVRSRVKECLPSSAMTNSTKENEAGLNTTSLADKS
jgi:vacuolar protein sorting-associated protein 54